MSNHDESGSSTLIDGVEFGTLMARTVEEENGSPKTDPTYAYLDTRVPHTHAVRGERPGGGFSESEAWAIRAAVLQNVCRTIRGVIEAKDYRPELYGDDRSELERAVEDIYGDG